LGRARARNRSRRITRRNLRVRVHDGDARTSVDAYDVEHFVPGDEYVRVRERLDGAQSQ
jgi:hypothetical protein